MADYRDYIQGRMDQERIDSRNTGETRVVNDVAREQAIQESANNQALALIIALKKARADRDEWKTYAKRLESLVDGAWAIRDALRDEINNCPNHSAHPLGLNKDAQLKLSDAAYIKTANENGLPESDWDAKVRDRNKK